MCAAAIQTQPEYVCSIKPSNRSALQLEEKKITTFCFELVAAMYRLHTLANTKQKAFLTAHGSSVPSGKDKITAYISRLTGIVVMFPEISQVTKVRGRATDFMREISNVHFIRVSSFLAQKMKAGEDKKHCSAPQRRDEQRVL